MNVEHFHSCRTDKTSPLLPAQRRRGQQLRRARLGKGHPCSEVHKYQILKDQKQGWRKVTLCCGELTAVLRSYKTRPIWHISMTHTNPSFCRGLKGHRLGICCCSS